MRRRLSAAEQYVTSAVADSEWAHGFPSTFGQVLGEIEILVATDGSHYVLNGLRFESLSDAEEAAQ